MPSASRLGRSSSTQIKSSVVLAVGIPYQDLAWSNAGPTPSGTAIRAYRIAKKKFGCPNEVPCHHVWFGRRQSKSGPVRRLGQLRYTGPFEKD